MKHRPLSAKSIIESLFKIETKDPGPDGKKVVPFVLNGAQASLDHSTLLHRMHVILKARQLGISSYIIARFLAKCMTVEGTHAAIVSHEKQATARLLRRAHFFLDNIERSKEVIPREYDNKYELTFPKKNSSLFIGTAGQRAFTRGDMITDFHGSEIAFWPEADVLMQGVIGALTGDAELFLESTANGMGGYFYEVCSKAQKDEGRGDYPFKFHFFPWHIDTGYAKPVRPGAIWSPEEMFLREKFKLSNEQMSWRRWKMSAYRSQEEFLQEFPISPEEAFIVTGTCYFDKLSLRAYQRHLVEPLAVGNLDMVGETPRFFRSEGGDLKIWEMPAPSFQYLIATDCSEGIESGDSDSTHIQVINRHRFAQAASINGKLDPSETAIRLYALGKYFNWAWIAVEANGPGLACLLKLKDLGYPRIYHQRRFDTDTQKETEKLGWQTDQRTRPLVLSELRSAIKKQSYAVRDSGFIKECTTFCRQKDGTYKANSSCHDDSVMANAIGVYLNGILPLESEEDDARERLSQREVFQRGHKTGY